MCLTRLGTQVRYDPTIVFYLLFMKVTELMATFTPSSRVSLVTLCNCFSQPLSPHLHLSARQDLSLCGDTDLVVFSIFCIKHLEISVLLYFH